MVYYPFFVFVGMNVVRNRISEDLLRHRVFNLAKMEADRLGRPLINFGCKEVEPFASKSDLNIDIVPRNVPNFELIQPGQRIPIPDDSAVVFASHVLEHVEDYEGTLNELSRLGPVYVVGPNLLSIVNWIHPEHRRIITRYGMIENPSNFALPLLTGSALLALST